MNEARDRSLHERIETPIQHKSLRQRGRPSKETQIMSHELSVGSPAPDFVLTADSGRQTGLAEYKGKSHVVLFFVREHV